MLLWQACCPTPSMFACATGYPLGFQGVAMTGSHRVCSQTDFTCRPWQAVLTQACAGVCLGKVCTLGMVPTKPVGKHAGADFIVVGSVDVGLARKVAPEQCHTWMLSACFGVFARLPRSASATPWRTWLAAASAMRRRRPSCRPRCSARCASRASSCPRQGHKVLAQYC